jgi:choline dehydrogenase-like flavoprotein
MITPLEQAIRASSSLSAGSASFDAIVVGGGAAGGLAAMMLTQAGMKVLVLDAGWRKPFVQAPVTRTTQFLVRAAANPKLYDILPYRLLTTGRKVLASMGAASQPIQSKFYAWPLSPGSFVDDREAPYVTPEGSSYNWFRVRQIGGRVTIPGHGRQYHRLPPESLSQTGDLTPWYERIEKLLGLSGGPVDSIHQPACLLVQRHDMHPSEKAFADKLKDRWSGASPMLGQWAGPPDTLSAAATTGLLTCRTGAVVRDIDASGGAKVVTWHDRQTGKAMRASAPQVFVGASTLETARILMMSKAADGATGIGSRSGVLGAGLMDHVLVRGDGVGGKLENGPFQPPPGRCMFLPRFDKRDGGNGAERPYGLQLYRTSWGADKSHFTVVAFGEMKARPENRVELDPTLKDAFGIPQLRVHFSHNDGDRESARRQAEAIRELADVAGAKLHHVDEKPDIGGTAMHEIGTARMGDSPASSVVDRNGECWEAPGVHVIDGAAMPEQGIQNPTLTILALAARACDYAIRARATASAGMVAAE